MLASSRKIGLAQSLTLEHGKYPRKNKMHPTKQQIKIKKENPCTCNPFLTATPSGS